jgi:TrmH family RNA methyltransferase
VKKISSSANAEFKQLRELVDSSRERRKAGLTVLDGIHLVQAYRDHVGAPERIVVSESGLLNNEIKQIVKYFSSSEILQTSDGLFKQLSQLATPTGILAVVKTPRPQPVPADMDSCILLEDLQDPGNLGSILRIAAAAGVGHVLLSKNSVQAWSPRVVRAGMGAHFMLQIHEQANLLTAAASFEGKVLIPFGGVDKTKFFLKRALEFKRIPFDDFFEAQAPTAQVALVPFQALPALPGYQIVPFADHSLWEPPMHELLFSFSEIETLHRAGFSLPRYVQYRERVLAAAICATSAQCAADSYCEAGLAD